MTTSSLSLFIRLGVNANSLKDHRPFNELNEKYRKQVIFSSELREFAKGDTVFAGAVDPSRYYYLLGGKLGYKAGLLSRKSLSSRDQVALFDIGALLPGDVPVVAVEPGHLLAVPADLMDTALVWMHASHQEEVAQPAISPGASEAAIEAEDENDWMSCLLASPLFFNLPPANISRVLALFERVPVAQEEVIIREGDEGHYFYVLIEGEARVVFESEPDRSPVSLSEGAYFGEDALVSGAPRSASVVMSTPGVVGRLDRENFQGLLQDPVIRYVTEEEVGQHLMQRGKACVLVDVRSAEEFAQAPSPNSRNMPCNHLRTVIPTLDPEATYFISPRGGKRSELAAHLFSQANLQVYVIRSTG